MLFQARRGNIELVIEDAKTTINVEGTRLVSRVLQYLRPYTNIASLNIHNQQVWAEGDKLSCVERIDTCLEQDRG